MSKLYEINQTLMNIIEDGGVFVDSETGEVFDQTALDELQMAFEDKVNSCLMVMRQYETDGDAAGAEIARLQRLKRSYQNRAAYLKDYVQFCLGGEKFKSSKFNVSYRNTRSVNITDWREVPDEYFKEQTEADISKSAIMADLKAGKTVPGAELTEKISMIVK